MVRWKICLAALPLLAALLCPSAIANAEDKGTVTVQVENDSVTGTDRNFTNGLRLTYLSPEVTAGHISGRIADRIPLLDRNEKLRFGIGIGHSIFTPNDTDRRDLILDDRPYAAWAHLSFSLLSYDNSPGPWDQTVDVDYLQTLVLDVGVVGPWAGGERVQNDWHGLVGIDNAEGWDNQLENEPGLMLTYERTWRFGPLNYDALGLGIDLMPHVGGTVGNVMTYGALGAALRIGHDLQRDFGPPRIRPSLPGSEHFQPNGLGWYLFAGIEGRAVARNIFLDGNSFEDSHSIDKRHLVGDLQFGAALTWWKLRASYTQVYRSSEAEGLAPHRFGAFALSWRVDF